MRVVFKFAVVLAIAAVGVFGVILSQRNSYDYDMFVASYSLTWFGTIGAVTVMASQGYRQRRTISFVRHVFKSFVVVVVMTAILAAVAAVVLSTRTGFVFAMMTVSTGAWIIVMKVDVMLIDAYDRGKAEVIQAVCGQAT